MEKEELSKMAEKMAERCREFIIQWRLKNRGAIEPPFNDPRFAYVTAELTGFLKALYITEKIDEEDISRLKKLAFPTFFSETSKLSPSAKPSAFADFIEGLPIDDFNGGA